MKSRYDAMFPSSTEVDPLDNQTYPDVLSANLSYATLNEPPIQYEPDDLMRASPYFITNALYGTDSDYWAYYDDVIFNLNAVPHLSLVENTPVVKYPVKSDLINIVRKKVNVF